MVNRHNLNISKRKRNNIFIGLLFILPGFIGFLIFHLIPVVASLGVSFTEWNFLTGWKGIHFNGFQNYIKLIHDEQFIVSLVNNLLFTAGTIPVLLVIGLVIAELINRHTYHGNAVRIMLFIPYISSIVAVCIVWQVMLQPNFGPINEFLKTIGINNPPRWLVDKNWALIVVMVVNIWTQLGNSFSVDATRYLHQIARSANECILVSNLYISGCSLKQHYHNMHSNERVYQYYFNGFETPIKLSLLEALCMDEWDYITLQQKSRESDDPDSYEPFVSSLVSIIRSMVPKAKILLHETWFYAVDYPYFSGSEYRSQQEMYDTIHRTYLSIANAIHADGIIPAGSAFYELAKIYPDCVHRDGQHASFGIGRYILALTWYAYLTGRECRDNSFDDFDEHISLEQVRACKYIVDGIIHRKNSFGTHLN